jgi:DNA-directed RNA polymerase specialized sigma54-like protein
LKAACKQKWDVVLKPDVNNNPWTSEEDKNLLKYISENKAHDWKTIAEKLDTNRNAFQCFRRYQRSLNPNMLKSKWTDEEDQLLTDAVVLYGEKNWQQISTVLEGRTGQRIFISVLTFRMSSSLV